MERLNNAQSLVIKQKKEWGEILTGFETRNKYNIMDGWGNQVFEAEEESGSLATILARFFLTYLRPFTMSIFSADGNELFTLKRPFRFYFHELDIYESGGVLLGKIKRRFALLRRIYAVMDRNDREIFQIFGPILRPWTFLIKKNDQEQGKIVKKWSGLGKEIFTDADNFGINFPKALDANQKAVFLGALFLIDFVHFEKKQN
ncbi:MAG: scramblase [Desulfobacterales bacterium]|nr:MAG: scramblase [Desulfobacterales bacterium]